ncbi:glycyl-tRNA synthetase beta chain [Allofrancisella inopinata]|uniref:Glycine--tRNA ligase beta subunit n=1 Tax=Allofrancisella inopinata TaxID=1085647 RepID=A0AAE6YIN7_9GAMM|nr:glycine--tRNA ligase subunit beta [Allofrancisella inopinata]QIV96157.1 glycine--tRNA ligase subunit beta [Allofrancisella inopinata]TDT72073.1 glycyl-tRNA synthetase beta chain [Allofrancisella inopinata]
MNNDNVTKDFLFELGTEELPPKALKSLAQSLLISVEDQLKQAGVEFAQTKWIASPRRLAFIINGLAESQNDLIVEKQGPLVSIAYKDNQPTQVGLGFAKSCGVEFEQLQKIDTPKGEKLFYKSIQKGQKTVVLLQEIITKALKQLPIPKMMRWGTSDAEFVRPVHWVLALYGDDIVDMEILGHKATNVTYGHRFHNPAGITITSVASYIDALENAMVIVDWDKRRQMIIEQAQNLAKQHGYKVVLDSDLVDEVCAIVEYPNAMLCGFNKDFLRVPQEALISSMQEHQKCFALLDNQNKLVANFITISNIKSTKPELVITGNQKVMNARLADAAFFYDTDLKRPLDSLLPRLENVTFHNKLGNMYQKAQRIAKTSKELAKLNDIDIQAAYRAGLLAKADLISDMVFEFTDLQGIIGKYYAKVHGEPDVIANAIEQQYWPKYSGAELPTTTVASCVALAEKLDTLVGIFGIGQKPTGNKDPFALRRSAIGILRILRDTDLHTSLDKVIELALTSYKEVNNLYLNSNTKEEVKSFCLDRLKNLYKEEGVSADIFESISSTGYQSIKDFDRRVKAVIEFGGSEKSQSLIASNKRVANILSKNSQDAISSYDIDLAKTVDNDYELNLANQIDKVASKIKELVSKREYSQALELLATLDETISKFFDNVMVMDENLQIRANRVALLSKLRLLFTSVADISRLQ